MSPDLEIEVKRSVAAPGLVLAVLRRASPEELGGFEGDGPLREVEVVDRFLDTGSGALEAAGLRARLRHVGGQVLVTAKGPANETDGVTTRRELEAPATDDLDPVAWPPSRARDEIAAAAGGQPLREQARLRQHRVVRDVRRGTARMELSLDHLEALVGDDVRAERWELEAELKAGTPADLGALGAALDRIPGVRPALGSKRAFALAATAP